MLCQELWKIHFQLAQVMLADLFCQTQGSPGLNFESLSSARAQKIQARSTPIVVVAVLPLDVVIETDSSFRCSC